MRRVLSPFVCAAFMMLAVSCGGEEVPPEFEKGFRVVKWWTSPSTVDRSAFRSVHPEGKPSEWLAYTFSPLGAAEWPPVEGGPEFGPDEEEALGSIGIPVAPKEVRFVRSKPDPAAGKQIVLRSDDSRGIIIATAYASADTGPIAVREYTFRN